jgi:hypothetical protein
MLKFRHFWGHWLLVCAQYLPLRFTLSPEYQHFFLSRWVVDSTLDLPIFFFIVLLISVNFTLEL